MGGRGGSGRGIAAQGPTASSTPATAAPSDPIFDIVERTIRSDPGAGATPITSLERVRNALSGMDRGRQDAEILRLARARKILLVPASNQKVMSNAERRAEIMFGNERKAHVMLP